MPAPVSVAVVALDLHPESVGRIFAVEVGGEAQRGAFVAFCRVPRHAVGVDAREDVVVEGAWDCRWESAGAHHVDSKRVVWEAAVRSSVHGEGFVVESLASHNEGFAWWARRGVEFDAATVLARFDCVDENVDLVAEFGGECGL